MEEVTLKTVDVALRVAGYNFKKRDLELIMRVIKQANSDTTIEQVLTIERDVNDKYDKMNEEL